jgi:hypothetical protein
LTTRSTAGARGVSFFGPGAFAAGGRSTISRRATSFVTLEAADGFARSRAGAGGVVGAEAIGGAWRCSSRTGGLVPSVGPQSIE